LKRNPTLIPISLGTKCAHVSANFGSPKVQKMSDYRPQALAERTYMINLSSLSPLKAPQPHFPMAMYVFDVFGSGKNPM
jgi:hypothetical protein